MPPVIVRRRRLRALAFVRRVVEGWSEALDEINGDMCFHGATVYLHRSDCGAPGGACECQIVFVGPAVRAHADGWA